MAFHTSHVTAPHLEDCFSWPSKYQIKQEHDCLAQQSPALFSEQDPTCLCRFSRLADPVGAVAHRGMRSERHNAFLRKKLEIITRLFLNSDIPPKLRVRPWDLPRKAPGCCLLIAQDSSTAGPGGGERGSDRGLDLLGGLWGMLWSLGFPHGLGGVGNNPQSDPDELRTSMWIRVGEMGMILQHFLLEKCQG